MSGRTFVVGDLHGCITELERLLDAIQPASGDRICFLGDYVDRGPSPRAVIDRLLRLQREGPECTFLKGNHEDMFLAYFGLPGRYGDAFLGNGGDVTLESYGIFGAEPAEALERFPQAHLDFLESLELSARYGEFVCVHAGMRPPAPLEKQSEEDLLWIREEFIDAPHPYGYTVLYGHTPRRDVHVDLPFKIGLDTGAVYRNLLSCLELETKELVQVRTGRGTILRRSLAPEFAAGASRTLEPQQR
jgi:serine/threonine protein phosphatase 1